MARWLIQTTGWTEKLAWLAHFGISVQPCVLVPCSGLKGLANRVEGDMQRIVSLECATLQVAMGQTVKHTWPLRHSDLGYFGDLVINYVGESRFWSQIAPSSSPESSASKAAKRTLVCSSEARPAWRIQISRPWSWIVTRWHGGCGSFPWCRWFQWYKHMVFLPMEPIKTPVFLEKNMEPVMATDASGQIWPNHSRHWDPGSLQASQPAKVWHFPPSSMDKSSWAHRGSGAWDESTWCAWVRF